MRNFGRHIGQKQRVRATVRATLKGMATPMMQMRYDENSIPVSAKCSVCGAQMPQAKPRITNPIDNVAWFTVQFDLHVSQNHHPTEPPKAFHISHKKTAK